MGGTGACNYIKWNIKWIFIRTLQTKEKLFFLWEQLLDTCDSQVACIYNQNDGNIPYIFIMTHFQNLRKLYLCTFCTVIFFKLIYTLDIILRNECMFWHLQILHHVKKNPILFGPFSISISVYFICTKAHPFCSVLCLPQFCQCDIFEMETCVIKFLMLTY